MIKYKWWTWQWSWLKRSSSPPPPALMCSWDRDRVRGSSRPSGSVGLCRMSCMAFLRPVLPEAMKSAYVASTSDIARASSTQQYLPNLNTRILEFSSIRHSIHMNSPQCAAYTAETGHIILQIVWATFHMHIFNSYCIHCLKSEHFCCSIHFHSFTVWSSLSNAKPGSSSIVGPKRQVVATIPGPHVSSLFPIWRSNLLCQHFLTSADSSTSAVTPSYISMERLRLRSSAAGPTSHHTSRQNKQNKTQKHRNWPASRGSSSKEPTRHTESIYETNSRILITLVGWFEKSQICSPRPSHLPPSRPMSSQQTAAARWLEGRHKRMRGESSGKHPRIVLHSQSPRKSGTEFEYVFIYRSMMFTIWP